MAACKTLRCAKSIARQKKSQLIAGETFSQQWTWWPKGSPSAPSIGTAKYWDVKTQAGYSLPNHQTLIRNRVNATTSYTMTHLHTEVEGDFVAIGKSGATHYELRGIGFNTYDFPSPAGLTNTSMTYVPGIAYNTLSFYRAEVQARERYFAHLREAEKRAQAMVPIAEMRDLSRLVGLISDDAARILRKIPGTRSYRNAKLTPLKRKDLARQIADHWLAWSFGMQPMMADAENIATAIAAMKWGSMPPSLKITGSGASESESIITRSNWQGNFYTGRHGYNVGLRDLQKVKYHVEYTNEWFAPKAPDDLDLLGINLREIPSTVWELISYSWLVDYFANIQKVLDAFAMRQIYDTPRCRTVHGTRTKFWEPNGAVYPGDESKVIEYSPTELRFITHTFERHCIDDVPLPMLRLKSIDEITKNWENKMANIAACIVINRRR
jgi:hypothetical protein